MIRNDPARSFWTTMAMQIKRMSIIRVQLYVGQICILYVVGLCFVIPICMLKPESKVKHKEKHTDCTSKAAIFTLTKSIRHFKQLGGVLLYNKVCPHVCRKQCYRYLVAVKGEQVYFCRCQWLCKFVSSKLLWNAMWCKTLSPPYSILLYVN